MPATARNQNFNGSKMQMPCFRLPIAAAALFTLSGCVPLSTQGAYGYGMPYQPSNVVPATEPGPTGRPVTYCNTHMPLVGRVPIRSEIVLRPRPDGTFLASAVTSASGLGSGRIEGSAIRRGTVVLVTQPANSNGPSCTLTMVLVRGRADTMQVSEDQGCHQWHGAAVEFEGIYRRAGQ